MPVKSLVAAKTVGTIPARTSAEPLIREPKLPTNKATGGSYRLQVRLPADWREAVEAAAARQGLSLSDFARAAIFDQLPPKVQLQLEDVSPGRPSGRPEGR